jgi:hypothetical protein
VVLSSETQQGPINHRCPLCRGQEPLRVTDELRVVACGCAVREDSHVFEPGPDAVASADAAFRDRPARDQLAVVDLLELDAGAFEHVLDCLCVGYGDRGIHLERLDEDAGATVRDSGLHESLGVADHEQTRLDANPAADQVIAELDDPSSPWFAVTSSGSSVQPATRASRRSGSSPAM